MTKIVPVNARNELTSPSPYNFSAEMSLLPPAPSLSPPPTPLPPPPPHQVRTPATISLDGIPTFGNAHKLGKPHTRSTASVWSLLKLALETLLMLIRLNMDRSRPRRTERRPRISGPRQMLTDDALVNDKTFFPSRVGSSTAASLHFPSSRRHCRGLDPSNDCRECSPFRRV